MIHLFVSLMLLTSCNGQSIIQKNKAEYTEKGDTVTQLGKSIMLVFQDKKNNYWFGSWETGVYKFDGKTIINYTTKQGLSSNRIDEIKEDKLGNIYFTSCFPHSVITKFDGNNFTKLTAIPTNAWKLQADDIWFKHSYQNEKVYRYDGSFLHELQLPKPPNFSNPYEIYSIYTDKNGNVWFGTNPLGVCRYNGNSFDWITENDVTEFGNGGANGIRAIAEDKNGDFWFNTEFRYRVQDSMNSDEKPFYSRQKSIGSLDGKADGNLNEYISIVKDNKGNLWFATYRNGVWKYDGKKITHYRVQQNAQDVTIFSVFKDNQDNIWLGTHENGAYKFNGVGFEKFK